MLTATKFIRSQTVYLKHGWRSVKENQVYGGLVYHLLWTLYDILYGHNQIHNDQFSYSKLAMNHTTQRNIFHIYNI